MCHYHIYNLIGQWELGSNGDGDPSCIANDDDNDFFTLHNKW